ncbi:phosphonate ABC transporter substrate-binding protein [Sphingomonas oleivorans]|uniref:Phosphonate ABC transporter substrate-binding protein n=1 Tax=Sphingomonas oleivorans TaxID=1735121 RepID=A0A2T5FV90_9SPHN|nr:phosphate/phosphite/phosphonate ABC transporter substrate-binding protein [Sphingomonas oleivorans]PTQ08864.1 phosphonate ABC transporter substrate-binding protein [Sphingomonas oleivorans]
MRLLFAIILSILCATAMSAAPARPLRVILIPADGGTESGTRADYQPIFNAISRGTGLSFDLKVAQSYGAVVEAMCGGTADIAFLGPVTYVQAHKRGCAELLAVAVEKGQSIYHAGLFARAGSGIDRIGKLKGKRVAFGDINSASSFVFPMAMIVEAKLDPVRDLAEVRLTGSHVNSLAALAQGRVDAAALSFESYEKAVRQDMVDPRHYRVIAKSIAIPYPPLAVNSRLPAPLKAKLRRAFAGIAHAPGVTPDMIRGYGGGRVDGYDTHFPPARFNVAAAKMALVDDALKSRILRKSASR